MNKTLEIKENQFFTINKSQYYVVSMMKFIEGSYYWTEYKVIKEENGKEYYLNIEDDLIALSEIVEEKIKPAMKIDYCGKSFELFQKGNAKIETYSGMADVGLRDNVEYYEYKNKADDSEIFTIEVWRNETEVSIGRYIKNNQIKILNKFLYE